MSSPVILTSGDPTPGRLWTPEVNMGTAGTPTWTVVQYVNQVDFNPDNPSLQDSTIYGDGGFSGQDKMGAAWSATLTVNRMTVPNSAPPSYDPAQEYIRAHGIGQFGRAARVQMRFYEYDANDPSGVNSPRIEAYMGYASVSWPGNGGVAQDAERMVAIGLAGKGKLNQIAHPYPPGASAGVPVLESVSPTTLLVAGGTAFRLTGSGFTGTVATTGVKFGGTSATSWTVWSDGEITGIAPAHTAGSGLPVVVTNATGASTTGPTVTFA